MNIQTSFFSDFIGLALGMFSRNSYKGFILDISDVR